MRKPVIRKTLRQTVADNQASIAFMAKLAGAPAPDFKVVFKDKTQVKRRPVTSPHPTEAQVLKSVLGFLRVHPDIAFCARFNSGTAEENGRFIQYHSAKGLSDILFMTNTGKFGAIEVKAHKGRLMPHQLEFLLKIQFGNGLAGVARSTDDAEKIIAGDHSLIK